MNKLKKPIADTPDVGWMQKIFGKTIEVIEVIAIVVVAIFVANLLGLM